jgi:hypothetical protein
MKAEFTDDEVRDIFDLAGKIEDIVDHKDYTTVFNALLLILASGGRNVAHTVSRDDYMHMVSHNIDGWWNYQDDMDAGELR